jgi:long-chain acyl-CoA synthetase
MTYGDFFSSTRNLASNLAELGVAPGERIAIWLPNSTEWVEAALAVARAGGIGVPISHDATMAEVLFRLSESATRVVITSRTQGATSLRTVAISPVSKRLSW